MFSFPRCILKSVSLFLLGNVYPLDEDTMTSGVGNEALDGAVAVGSGNEENIEPIRGNQIEVVTSSQNDLLNPYDILSNSQNSDAFAETIIIERGKSKLFF